MCVTRGQLPTQVEASSDSATPLSTAWSQIRRLSALAHLPLWHEAVALAQTRELRRFPLWRSPPVDAHELPVVVVGGLGGSAQLLSPLVQLLRRYNCRCVVAPTGFGIACGEAATRIVEETIVELADAAGQRVLVIGHSRGGQFARAAAVRRAGQVAGLVTLGSPLVHLLGVSPLLRIVVGAIGVGGLIGIPGMMGPGCLWGRCCRRLRADIAGPFPATVAFTSIFSRTDAVVSWRSCLDPAARHIEVDCTHGGMLWCPRSLQAITTELINIITRTNQRTSSPPLISNLRLTNDGSDDIARAGFPRAAYRPPTGAPPRRWIPARTRQRE